MWPCNFDQFRFLWVHACRVSQPLAKPGDFFYKTSVDGQPLADESIEVGLIDWCHVRPCTAMLGYQSNDLQVPPGFDQTTDGLTVGGSGWCWMTQVLNWLNWWAEKSRGTTRRAGGGTFSEVPWESVSGNGLEISEVADFGATSQKTCKTMQNCETLKVSLAFRFSPWNASPKAAQYCDVWWGHAIPTAIASGSCRLSADGSRLEVCSFSGPKQLRRRPWLATVPICWLGALQIWSIWICIQSLFALFGNTWCGFESTARVWCW